MNSVLHKWKEKPLKFGDIPLQGPKAGGGWDSGPPMLAWRPHQCLYLSHHAWESQLLVCQTTEPRSWNTTRSAPPLAGHLVMLDRRSGTQAIGKLSVISWVIGQNATEKDSNPNSDDVAWPWRSYSISLNLTSFILQRGKHYSSIYLIESWEHLHETCNYSAFLLILLAPPQIELAGVEMGEHLLYLSSR